jgi:hypothetical protein
MDGGITQAVEHLPSKCKALSSSPSTNNNKKIAIQRKKMTKVVK